MSDENNRPILGQEAVVGRDGLGRVTEIGPTDRCGSGQPEWIGVTPYVGRTWQMNFAPHNVRLIPIERIDYEKHLAEIKSLREALSNIIEDLDTYNSVWAHQDVVTHAREVLNRKD
jgi:hypothetical protein